MRRPRKTDSSEPSRQRLLLRLCCFSRPHVQEESHDWPASKARAGQEAPEDNGSDLAAISDIKVRCPMQVLHRCLASTNVHPAQRCKRCSQICMSFCVPFLPGGVTLLHSSPTCLGIQHSEAQDQLCVKNSIQQPVLIVDVPMAVLLACRPASPTMTFSPPLPTPSAEAMVIAMASPCHVVLASECQESSPALAAAQLPPAAARSAVMQANWQCSGRREPNRPTCCQFRQWQHPRHTQRPRGLSVQGRRRQTLPHRDALCHLSRQSRAWSLRRSC